MTDLFFLPSDLTEMSVAQLAALTAQQKAQIDRHLHQSAEWLTHARANFDASLVRAYGERIAQARAETPHDVDVVHIDDGDVRLSVAQSACVTWDQTQLAAIAKRIVAAGERVEEFLDVAYSIPDARFHHWPSALRAQFERARTVTPNAPAFRLTSTEEV